MECSVKSEAYGHGSVEVSETFLRAGARWFGVASIAEAEMLRKTSLKLDMDRENPRILLMSDATNENIKKIVSLNLDPVVWNHEQIISISNFAKSEGVEVRAHLKVDTGMGRLGINMDNHHSIFQKSYFIQILKGRTSVILIVRYNARKVI